MVIHGNGARPTDLRGAIRLSVIAAYLVSAAAAPPARAARPELAPPVTETIDSFRHAPGVAQDAYLAGLIDGLRQGGPQPWRTHLATCMAGFPPARLREIAADPRPPPGLPSARPGAGAAGQILMRMAWTCQLQSTSP